MGTYSLYIGFTFLLFLVGVFYLILGDRIAARRVIVIRPQAINSCFVLLFLTIWIGCIAHSFEAHWYAGGIYRGILALLIVSASLLIFSAQFWLFSGREFWLFNTNGDAVVKALGETLHSHGIVYQASKRMPFGKYATIWVIFDLPELGSSIRIRLWNLAGQAQVRFVRKKRIPEYDMLVADFEHALKQEDAHQGFAFSWAFLLGAVACFLGAGMGVLRLFQM